MSEPMIRDVPDTAFMVAMDRAIESERPDALFDDPFAAKLAGERGRTIAEWRGKKSAVGQWAVAMRTSIIDDLIRGAIDRGIDAVVNLGAGLDSRPYRLDLPATLGWIEVDYPQIIDWKTERLADDTPRCALEHVRLDLSRIDERRALFGSLAKRFENALIITEGVVPYLSVDDVGLLAEDLRAAGNVRGWIVDYFAPEVLAFRKATSGDDFANAPFKFEPTDWRAFFEAHGWRPTDERYFVDEGLKHNRPPPITQTETEKLIAASPMSTMREPNKFAGYFLMEPIA